MPSKPSLSPLLSGLTTFSKKSLKILCLWRSVSLSESILSFSLSFSSNNLISPCFLSISACSLASFYSSIFLFYAFCSSMELFSLTSLMVFSDSSLCLALCASTSLALAIISSFCLVKFSSVSLSSLSFWRSLTA